MTTPFLYIPTFAPIVNGASVPNGLLYTYAAGTTTPKPTFQDAAGVVPNSNPVQLDISGAATVRLEPGSYHFVLTDSTGTTVLWDQDFYTAPYLTASDIAALINGASSAENAAGVTPTNYLYPIGDVRRYGVVGDGLTDDTVALQNAINASAGAVRLYVPKLTCKLSARITAPANTHLVLERGCLLNWVTTTATGSSWLGTVTRPGIEVLGDGFILEGGRLQGPSSAVYVSNEFGILRVGPGSGNQGAASPGTGFVVRDCEIFNWGSGGIATQFVDNVDIEQNNIHDCGYEGIHLLSPKRGKLWRNRIKNITPGNGSNAYGISCTHDSRNYNTDPAVAATGAYSGGGNQRQAVNPFPIGMDIRGNTVENVASWIGIDFHGAWDCVVDGNRVYNCFRGIQVSSSSGDAANYAGENNKITNNVVYANQIDGSATTVANGGAAGTGSQAGITVNGGAATAGGYHRRVTVSGNTVVGTGNKAGGTNFAIEAAFQNDCIIANNQIWGCYGDAIIGASFDGQISGNLFGNAGQTANSRAIYLQGSNGHAVISGNRHDAHGGNVYATGIDILNSSPTRVVMSGNEFDSCTTPITAAAGQLTRGLSDVTPRISDTATGSHTVDVSVVGVAPVVYVELNAGGSATITSFTNPQKVGQKLIVANLANTTCTINDSGNIRLSGGTAAVVQFSTIEFVCQSLSSPCWFETCRSLSNT